MFALIGAATNLSFFFLNDPATPEISTLPLHAPLPISAAPGAASRDPARLVPAVPRVGLAEPIGPAAVPSVHGHRRRGRGAGEGRHRLRRAGGGAQIGRAHV